MHVRDCQSDSGHERRRARIAGLAGYLLVAGVCLTPLMFFEPSSVSGASMSPALAPGDLVFVRRHGVVHVGDMALIREPGHKAFIHRVVATQGTSQVRTRGDANPIQDFDPVPRARIVGPVVAVAPVGKVIARWRGRR